MTKYRVLRAFAYLDDDGNTVQTKLGSVVELPASTAKPFAKIKAVGLYFEDDEDDEDDAPAPESRAQKRARRTRKPAPKAEPVEDATIQD